MLAPSGNVAYLIERQFNDETLRSVGSIPNMTMRIYIFQKYAKLTPIVGCSAA